MLEANVVKFTMKARFDGNSELVAELVVVNGFKGAYAIKDGAEGPRGWMVFFILFSLLIPFLTSWNIITSFKKCILQNSGLPWIPPKKAFSLDLGDLSDTISGAFGVCFLLPFPFNRKSNFMYNPRTFTNGMLILSCFI